MKITWNMLLAALVCALALSGCAASESPASAPARESAAVPSVASSTASTAAASEEAGMTVTDMLGNEVTVSDGEKIVSLAPSATEILFALGLGDRVVGVDAYSNYPQEAAAKDVVGDFNGPDIEKIVSLEPDIIFCGNTLQKEQIADLKRLGMTVAATEAVSFEDIPKSIEMMGKILGKEAEASAIVDRIHAAVAEANKKAPKEEITVYYAMSYGDMGNWTSGPGSFINSMIEIAGGVPITRNAAQPWLEYPLEQLVLHDPDVILFSSDMGSTDDISKAPGYKDLSAVKNKKVYQMQADVLSRPGPRIADAILAISETLSK